jgi:magnesium chelatase subunit I
MSIANYESLMSNALRRTILLREDEAVPRISDLPSVIPSSSGKIELETVEEGKEAQVIEELLKKAVKKVFNQHFKPEDFSEFLRNFADGGSFEVSDTMPTAVYSQKAHSLAGFANAIRRLNGSESPAGVASVLEFILEGLHLNKKLNKKRLRVRSLIGDKRQCQV